MSIRDKITALGRGIRDWFYAQTNPVQGLITLAFGAVCFVAGLLVP